MIKELKEKFKQISDNLDNVHDQEELMKLSKIAQISSDAIRLSLKSTQFAHSDSENSNKSMKILYL
jgi:hypothetical protein